MTVDGLAIRDPDRNTQAVGPQITRCFVELDGRRVSYLKAGDSAAGHPILLIHGSGVSAGCWVNQLRGLREALRMMAIDLPGHGESDSIRTASVEEYADTVAKFLKVLGSGPVIVVGHSLGGAVAIALAARRPDTVSALVLLASCAKLPGVDSSRERWLAYLPGVLRRILYLSMAQKLLFAPGVPRYAVRLGMQELRSCRPETIRKDLEAAKAMDVADQAAGLDVPTLILCGSRDRLTPPALSERLRDLIPRSRLCIIDGAGHMLLLEVPERVNQEVLNFARSLTAQAAVPPVTVVQNRRGHSLVLRFFDWVRGLW